MKIHLYSTKYGTHHTTFIWNLTVLILVYSFRVAKRQPTRQVKINSNSQLPLPLACRGLLSRRERPSRNVAMARSKCMNKSKRVNRHSLNPRKCKIRLKRLLSSKPRKISSYSGGTTTKAKAWYSREKTSTSTRALAAAAPPHRAVWEAPWGHSESLIARRL